MAYKHSKYLSEFSGGTIYSGSTDISDLFLTTGSTTILTGASAYSTTLDPGVQSPGINVPNGTTVADISGQTFSDFIDNYVFPTVYSTIGSNLSLVLGGVSTSTVEVGTTISPTLTATFNQGDIDNGNGTSGPSLVGLPNLYTFTGPGISTSVEVVSSSLSEAITTSNSGYSASDAAFGTNRWNIVVDYDQGTGDYFDSKGNIDTTLDASRVSGNTNDYSNIYTGRRYAFYDTGILPSDSSEVRTSTDRAFLNASNAGSFTITIDASEPLVFFAVPAGKSATVLYVESSNADVTGSFSVTTFNVDDAAGNPVSYDIYTSTIGGGGYPSEANYSVTIS